MRRVNHAVWATVSLALTLVGSGCGTSKLDLRQGSGDESSTDDLSLSKSAPTATLSAAEDAYKNELTKQILTQLEARQGSGKQADLKVNGKAVSSDEITNFLTLNKNAGVKRSGQMVNLVPQKSSFGLANTCTSNQQTVTETCQALFPSDPVGYEQCVATLSTQVGETGSTKCTGTVFSFYYMKPAAPGMPACVYARVSMLAVGVACGVPGQYGYWAGCDVWNGCGSGEF